MARNPDAPRNAAIGCLMLPMGAGSGAMVGVMLSKVAQYLTRGPTCDWHVYAGWGALAGALSLPALVIRRLLQAPPRDTTPDTNRS